VNYGQID